MFKTNSEAIGDKIGMKMVFLLYIMNVKEVFRDLKRNLLYFFLPIVIFVGFFSYYQINKVELNFIKPITVGVIVEEETIFAQMLIDDFTSKKELSQFFRLVQAEPSQLRTMFEQKEIDAIVTIPQNFVSSLMSFSYLPIQVIMHQDDPVKTLILYQGFRGYERYIQSVEKAVSAFYNEFYPLADEITYWEYNDALSIELIMTVLNRADLFMFEKITDIPSIISRDYYFIALTLLFIFYFSVVYTVVLFGEIKSQVFQRLMVTKLTVVHYLNSKIMVMLSLLGILVSMWTFLYSIFFKEPFFFRGKLAIALLVICLLSIEINLLLALWIRKVQEYFMITNCLIFFNAIVGGSIIPIHFMPESLKFVAKFTPNFYGIKVFLLLKNDVPLPFYGLLTLGTLVLCGLYLVIVLGYTAVLKGGRIE